MSRSLTAAARGAALLAALLLPVACGVKGSPRPRAADAARKDPLADLPFRPPVDRATSLDAGPSLPDAGVVDTAAPVDAGPAPAAATTDAGT